MDVLSRFALTDRVAIVTGASSGLGAHAALGLAAAGADVVLVARRADRLAETSSAVAATGRRCELVVGSVTEPQTATEAVETAMSAFGRVDVLVNNAGVAAAVPATREEPGQFRSVVDVNLNGAYWMAQACGRAMRPGSAIVNVGSVLGSTTAGLPQAAYASSKAAVIGLTRDLAAQWTGRKGIRVNAVAPGFFDSEMTAQYRDGYVDELMQTRVPAGRQGLPEEFVAAVVFLASDAASYVSGVVLPVDGGMLTT